MLAVYHKAEDARFISHLDILRALQRAFRRAGLPLKYSDGFNPHPELSFASALATGMTSDAEWFEVELTQDMTPEAFVSAVNPVLSRGLSVSDAREMPAGIKTLTSCTRAAEYRITISTDQVFQPDMLEEALHGLLSGDIVVNKRTKSGIKPVNIRPQILKAAVEGIENDTITLRVLGQMQADGGLRAELFAGALLDRLDAQGVVRIHRTAMFFDSDGSLPRIPSEERGKELHEQGNTG
ncbi:MAG: TIGR03936 family radical SAM-associated protein [Clostridia bacterium]|nr:TIGR03936 family radical SAM-associated protein [Clostridia bacterium]